VRLERHDELAGELEVAVDAVPIEVGAEALEVLVPEPLEGGQLVREAREAVLEPVRQRADDEAAGAAARAEADRVSLEDDDVRGRIVGLGVERGPEAGEAAADDAEIDLGDSLERGFGRALRQRGEPVRTRLGVGERRAVRGGRRRRGPGEGDAASLRSGWLAPEAAAPPAA
jgi:hypothetical protein